MRPCIRGLEIFKKKGCPEKFWDGKNGCPAWKEYIRPGEPGKAPVKIADCIDVHSEGWIFEQIKLLEQLIVSVQSLRNNLSEKGPDGNFYPKSSFAEMTLVSFIQQKQEQAMIQTENKIKDLIGE